MQKIIIIVLCLGLAACASAPQSTYLSPKQRQQALSCLRTWRAQGSISVTAQGKRNMLSFNWDQKANDLFIIRFSEFTYSAVLQNDHGKLTFSQPIQDISPDLWQSLIATQFWLRGLPVPADKNQGKVIKQYDSYGRLVMLSENGWLIQYQRYHHYFGYDLPEKIMMTRPGAQLYLVINHWSLSLPKEKVFAVDPNVILLKSI